MTDNEGNGPIDGGTVDGAQLAPGSEAAVAAGCRCPVGENGRGMGAWGGAAKDAQGMVMFWIAELCPLHGAERRLE